MTVSFRSDAPSSRLRDRIATRISTEIGAQHGQFLLWSPVFLAIGIGIYFGLDTEPPHSLWRTGFVVSVLMFGTGLSIRKKDFSIAPTLWALSGGLSIVLAGLCVAQMHTERIRTLQIGHAIGPIAITGTVLSTERLAPGQGQRLVLGSLIPDDPARVRETLPDRARVRLRHDDPVNPGDRIHALVKLLPTSRPVAPGSYDYQKDLYFRGIGASGFIYGHAQILEKHTPSTMSGYLESLRQAITDRVSAALPPPESGVVATFLTGEGTTISKEDWTALRGSGLAHLLALSGMNVAVVAAIAFFISRLLMAAIPPLALRFPIKKYAAIFAFVAALAYTLLVGAQVPVLRSLLMTGAGLFAIIIDRSPFSMRLLALSALIVLILSPQALGGASFQMSFAAVGALIFAYDAGRTHLSALYRQANWLKKSLLYLAGICVTSLIATLATAPFSLFDFQTLALYGGLANLVGVPLMSFIVMPAALAAYVLMPFGLEGWALEAMRIGVNWTLATAHATAALPGAVLSVPIWPQSALGLIVLGVVFALLWRGWGRVAGVVPIILALVMVAQSTPPDLLISETGALVAFRDETGGLHPSSRRSERFTFENWMRQAGLDPQPVSAWPKEGRQSGPGYELTCEPAGCRLALKNRRIAIVRHAGILKDECAWAEVIVASVPLRKTPCAAPDVVDRFDVWKDGAHAVFLDKTQAARIDSVAQYRGERPWVKPPEKRAHNSTITPPEPRPDPR